MGTLKDFQEVFKELLADNHLNVEKLAKLIHCHRSAIDRWVDGTYYPSYESLIKIADWFHCSIDYLFGLTDNMEFAPKPVSNFLTRYNELLKREGLTDYKTAKLCRIGNSAIAKWRKKNRIPETETLIELSKIFDCPIEYLIGRC